MDKVIKNVQRWLNDEYSAETKKKIRLWAEIRNFDLLNEAFGKEMEWKQGGIRAKMGIGTNRINHYTVGAIAQAFVNYLKSTTGKELPVVGIAYDNRDKSSYFAEIMTEVISANGMDVWIFDILAPLPVLAHGVINLGFDGGLMVTGGHNEKSYNGVKFLNGDGFALTDKDGEQFIEALRNIVSRSDIANPADHRHIKFIPEEIEQSYIDKLLSHFIFTSGEKALSLCYTPWYGTGTVIGADLFEKAGFKNLIAAEEQFQPSASFEDNYADPAAKNNLHKILEKAVSEKADMVIATSSDCAKVTVAARTKEGYLRKLNGQQMASLAVNFLLEKLKKGPERLNRKQLIAKTRTTTEFVTEKTVSKGFSFKEVESGLTNEIFNQRKVLFGVEEHGGLLIPELSPVKDGLLYGLLFAEMAEEAKKRERTLWDLLYNLYMEDGVHADEMEEVFFTGPEAEKLVENTIHQFISKYPSEIVDFISVNKIINYIDGGIIYPLTGEVDFLEGPSEMLMEFFLTDGSRIMLRPSRTPPSIKYYASCHQLIEKPDDLALIEEALKEKAKRLINYFKYY